MRRFIATAVLLATFHGPLPLSAQTQLDPQDLRRTIEDALAASEPDTTPLPRPEILDFDATEPDLLADDELDDLLAPVALYPDSLLAQVLVASTFPLQIVQADRILEGSADLTDAEVTEAIDARDWDPSVLVLLTGFPDVIRRMAEDLDDTERLGIAMGEQDEDVLASVQRLREQADATGWLEDNDAQIVERVDDRIVITPADPEVVYVPRYDPQMAFISPPTAAPVIQRPGTNPLANPLVAGAIGFGSALLVNELFGDDDADNDKNGWDDYWRKDRRTIDWRERQLYPRAGEWDNDDRRRQASWSRERDRYWDREGKRWRAETAAERREAQRDRRPTRAWQVRRDPETGRAQVRLQDWTDVRATERRENQADRRNDAERKQEAEAEARRREAARGEADKARRERAHERQAEQTADERFEAQKRRDTQSPPGAAAERAREAEASQEAKADRARRAARRETDDRGKEAPGARADREQAAPSQETREQRAAQRKEADRQEARQAAEAGKQARARQAERAQAEQAEARRKKAARERQANEPSKAAAEPAAAQREPEAQAKRPTPQTKAKQQAGSQAQQADQPARKAEQAQKQPTAQKKKRKCAAGDKGCVPKN